MKFTVATAALITATNAFPHMAKIMAVDDAALEKRFTSTLQSFANFVPTGYKGQTGAYGYVAPKPSDFRGPCPGLNTAANHGYLPHNGVATFAQYVDAQMSLYNVGLDLAILLATIAVPLDGDIITTKMSIGGDATPLTANPLVLAAGGKEGGLIVHNTFEADSSLTRNDVFPANGDNYNFNGTLFKQMKDTCDKSSGGLYDRNCMTIYRKRRYDDSRATNPNFYFGIKSLLLYGASSFLYELMPTLGGQPDYNTIAAFFGAVPNGSGGFNNHKAGEGEHIPPNWFPRAYPYTIPDVGGEIFAQYAGAPVEFGGNAGLGNFNGESFGTQLTSGKLNAQNAQDYQCLLFMIATENVPSAVGSVPLANADQLSFANLAVTPARAKSGCPAVTGQPVLGALKYCIAHSA